MEGSEENNISVNHYVDVLRDRIDKVKEQDKEFKEFAKAEKKRKKRTVHADSDLTEFLE